MNKYDAKQFEKLADYNFWTKLLSYKSQENVLKTFVGVEEPQTELMLY